MPGIDYLDEANHALYAQLVTELVRSAAPGGRGLSFVKKRVRGGAHWYLQVVVGGARAQHYLGPDAEELREKMARQRELWRGAVPDRRERSRLVAMLAAGGAAGVSPAEARVLELLEEAGVFLAGGTLVGSHAFAAYANMLGVRWPRAAVRTQDSDIGAEHRVQVGIAPARVGVREALLRSGMGFFEVPALDRRSPSTSYTMRGRRLTVDLLTPLRGRPPSRAIHVPALNAVAEPVRFLEYVLADTRPAAIVARAGILLNVPSPARYALHKLVTAVRRPDALQAKSLKDSEQACLLIGVLSEDRPGDLVLAWEAAGEMPERFREQLARGLARLPSATSGAFEVATGWRP